MMETQDMKTIMNLFSEKILMNLIYSNHGHQEEDANRIINVTLDVFSFYTQSNASCRLIANTDIMEKLIREGQSTFQILMHPSQLKQLSHFYRTLICLWLSDDFV